ncbi:proline-rich receptor-like protein kinase PERK2 [Iris pallida]|uniref:Proline-rich receptor-like protein kinase PERK2 n=1 Tax=Iris pallida TaxID=29817 RepID=A0AAX6EM55_IRIPA|nr:proline-rich receptor-like protein kinase PERK2 [Iris pallida]
MTSAAKASPTIVRPRASSPRCDVDERQRHRTTTETGPSAITELCRPKHTNSDERSLDASAAPEPCSAVRP